MSLVNLILIILVLALFGVIPAWPHSAQWGYGPSGGVGTLLVILLVLMALGVIR